MSRRLRITGALLSLFAVLFMTACSDDEDHGEFLFQEFTYVFFDPASGSPADIAIPNNLLINPATGLVNLPLSGEPFDSANTLRGFSTLAPLVLPFEGQLDASSLSMETMPVFRQTTDLASLQPAPMAYAATYDAASNRTTVTATPVFPLAPGSTYIAIVTRGVLDNNGRPVESQLTIDVLKRFEPIDPTSASAALEPVRQAYQPIWQFAEAVTGQQRGNIPFAWAFNTQPLFAPAVSLRTAAGATNPTPTIEIPLPTPEAVDQFFQSQGLGSVPHNAIGSMYKGSFEAPNYIGHPLVGPMPRDPQGNPTATGTSTINFWAALPAQSAINPPPTVIFQHGLTGAKENVLAIANTLCTAGFGVIAIDIVLHGERTMDFLDNETGAIIFEVDASGNVVQQGDGIPDPSGSNFINLGIPRMTRDNALQTLSDQFVLTQMIQSGNADFNGDGQPELGTNVSFVGQSLGALFGTVFATMQEGLNTAVLNVPGGRLSGILTRSQSISPGVNAGLAAQGIATGSADYNLFFLIFQTVLDDADPMNYATQTLNAGLKPGGQAPNILLQEAFEDQVIPNTATADLTRAMGLAQVSASWEYPFQPQVTAPHVGSGHFQYTNAAHGFLLIPTDPSVAAGQLQTATYLGTALQGSPTIIDPFAAGKTLPEVGYMDTPEIDTKFLVTFPKAVKLAPQP
ncbi:hypothetical protein [Acanthopleuribacter pedis]|uniref:Bacterial virulence factor lipase N-terminal domain-containing protein n=1 Tax=Acanthopleuribacter pedis TaxID=442870 RepID=A0A8J7U3V6_9BACT|nr:hypothetical protein [Acanthopleuribacter pedis]MBO1318718.1 hypothetical protein [Acanthopleuribacter pedis]